jgi:hypothetical protein
MSPHDQDEGRRKSTDNSLLDDPGFGPSPEPLAPPLVTATRTQESSHCELISHIPTTKHDGITRHSPALFLSQLATVLDSFDIKGLHRFT